MQDKSISNGLDPLRKEIDEIDSTLLKLLQRRMEVVKGVGEYKKANNLPIFNENREQQVIDKIVAKLNNPIIENEMVELFNTIMKVSRDYQDKIIRGENNIGNNEPVEEKLKGNYKVAYHGLPGSFSEEAVDKFFDKGTEKINSEEFEDVLRKLKEEEVDYAVLPIEDSSTGGIHETYDLLKKYDAFIVGEKVVQINHNLLVTEDGTLGDIKEIYSAPQAFSQSHEYLQGKPWNLVPFVGTASSAKFVSENKDKTKAAIASKKAAEVYNLKVLEKNINFYSTNSIRFIIVGRKLQLKETNDKISLVFSTPHVVGALYKVLSNIFNNKLNMLKIESRPIYNKPWEYYFYVDIQGNLLSENVKNAIEKIKKDCSYFHILGNYTADY
ncbi:MAG: prephenate dehydratase [Clostridiaceae bacterium]